MYIILTLLLYFIFHSKTCTSLIHLDNNACSHLEDYPIRAVSRNCYHNPDVKAPTVSYDQNRFQPKQNIF
jgi:hypothetical protein